MVAVHFDFCLFFSLLPLLAALFALSLLFCKELQQQGEQGLGGGQSVVDAVIYSIYIQLYRCTCTSVYVKFVMASAVHNSLCCHLKKKNHGDLKYQNYGQNALHNVLQ